MLTLAENGEWLVVFKLRSAACGEGARRDCKGETGGSETCEQVVGRVQGEALEPELGPEQRPGVKLASIPEAVLGPQGTQSR